MQITIELPDDIATQLMQKSGNLSQKALESLAVESYRDKLLNHNEVGRMLELSPEAVDALFRKANVHSPVTEQNISSGVKAVESKQSRAQLLEEIRQICEEENFTLEIPPRQNRPNQFVIDDVSI